MSSTVDDILNASDSEDDSGGAVAGGVIDDVDLEGLLKDDDDDDDNDNTNSSGYRSSVRRVQSSSSGSDDGNKNSNNNSGEGGNYMPSVGSKIDISVNSKQLRKSPTSSPSSEIDVNKLLDDDDDDDEHLVPGVRSIALSLSKSSIADSVYNSTAAVSKLTPSGEPKTSTTFSSSVSSISSSSLAGLSTLTSSKSVTEVDYSSDTYALQIADDREQKFLTLGNKDIVNILQSKTSKSSSHKKEDLTCIHIERLKSISLQLKRNSEFKNYGPGIASTMWVGSKYIAVGTSRGLVLVFDFQEEIKQILGSSLQNDASKPPVAINCIDANQSGSLLVTGNAVGEIVLWEVAKGNALKRISDLHSARIIKVDICFSFHEQIAAVQQPPTATQARRSSVLGMMGGLLSSVTSSVGGVGGTPDQGGAGGNNDAFLSSLASDHNGSISVITVDARGMVNRVKFTKGFLSNYSADSDCLLDGSAGLVHDIKNLRPKADLNPNPSSPLVTTDIPTTRYPVQNLFTALGSETRTYIIQIFPTIRIVHRWLAPAAPTGAVLNADASTTVSVVKSAPGSAASAAPTSPVTMDWGWVIETPPGHIAAPFLKPVLFRAWGNIIEALVMNYEESDDRPTDDLKNYKFASQYTCKLDSDAIALRVVSDTQFIVFTAEKVVLMNFQLEIVENINHIISATSEEFKLAFSVAVSSSYISHTCGKSIYYLQIESVIRYQIQNWIEKVDTLIEQGKWLESLSLLLDHYNQSEKTYNNQISRDSTSSSKHDTDMFAGYMKKYLQLALSQNNSQGKGSSSQLNHHFRLVAGVCFEICCAVDRSNLLFTDIYDTFRSSSQQQVFLECYEPYILTRKITTLPVHILKDFAEFSVKFHQKNVFERCIVFLDVTNMDLNFVIKFLLDQKMFSAMLYVYSYGLFDFGSAFKAVFEAMLALKPKDKEKEKEGNSDYHQVSPSEWSPTPAQSDVGFKLILFLQYAVQNKLFPRRGPSTIPHHWLISLVEVFVSPNFLVLPTNASQFGSIKNDNLWRTSSAIRYPYLLALSKVDTNATIYTVCQAIKRVQDDTDIDEHTRVDYFYYNLFLFCKDASTRNFVGVAPNTIDIFFSFCKNFIAECPFQLQIDLITEYIFFLKRSIKSPYEAELVVSKMVGHQSRFNFHINDIIEALESAHFFKTSLDLYINRNQKSLVVALDRGLKYYVGLGTKSLHVGDNEKSRDQVFDFIESAFVNMEKWTSGSSIESDFVKSVVDQVEFLSNINIDRLKAIANTKLVSHFADILNKMQNMGQKQLVLCKSMVEYVMTKQPTEFQDIFTVNDIFTYMKLMLTYQPDDLYEFVSSCDHYPLDESIAFFSEHKVNDIVSILVEKTGEVTKALELLLSDLSKRLLEIKQNVDRTLQSEQSALKNNDKNVLIDILSNVAKSSTDSVAKLSFYKGLNHMLNCIISLCRRHSSRSSASTLMVACDYILEERAKLGTNLSSTGEILRFILGILIQDLISAMKDMVSTQEVIMKVFQKYAQGSKYMEFKEVLKSLIASFNIDELLLTDVRNIHLTELISLQRKSIRLRRCGKKMSRSDDDEMKFGADATQQDSAVGSVRASNTESELKRPVRTRFRTYSGMMKALRDVSHKLDLSPTPAMYDSDAINDDGRRPGSLQRHAEYNSELVL